jgi:hypothetical protein
MSRLARGVASWVAGTAIAVTVAWLGAEVVLRDAASGGPQLPVLGAASPAPSGLAPSGPAPSGGRARSGGRTPSAGPAPAPARSPRVRPSASGLPPSPGAASPVPGPAPASPAAGTIRSYALTGGRVTLEFAASSVQLVTATPAAGFSVQTWSASGWLRVDFGDGAGISSLIATWNSGAPTVETFADG